MTAAFGSLQQVERMIYPREYQSEDWMKNVKHIARIHISTRATQHLVDAERYIVTDLDTYVK